MYKGFTSYSEAHRVWNAFVDHNALPPDVSNSLFGRPSPLPPANPQPNIGGLADSPSPTPLRPSQTPLQALATTSLGRLQFPIVSNAEDFWVVLTGAHPGVYQGQ